MNESESSATTGTATELVESSSPLTTEVIESDSLVEEISIDGMCGVY